MTKRDKLKHCVGCTNNFYNGNNSIGVQECWSLPDAKLVKRIRVGVWQNPPYDRKDTVKVFQCRHENGSVLVNPESLTEQGYWRSR